MEIIAIAAAVIAALSLGFSVYSSVQQGKSQQEIFDFNAAQQAKAAQEEKEAASSDAFKQAKLDDAEMAANRVYYNTSGVRIDENTTPALSLETQAGYRGMNVAAIRQRGYAKASQQLAASQISTFQGGMAKKASMYQAGTSLLSGTASILNSYNVANFYYRNTPTPQ